MSEMTVPTTTRLPLPLHAAAAIVAEVEMRSMNNLIQFALAEYLRSRSHLLPPEVRASLMPGWQQ